MLHVTQRPLPFAVVPRRFERYLIGSDTSRPNSTLIIDLGQAALTTHLHPELHQLGADWLCRLNATTLLGVMCAEARDEPCYVTLDESVLKASFTSRNVKRVAESQACAHPHLLRAADDVFMLDSLRPRAAPKLQVWNGEDFEPYRSLPAAREKDALKWPFGRAETGAGAHVLIWGPNGWERNARGRWEATFTLNADDRDWQSVPCGDDGFYYLHQCRIWRARRGREPERVFEGFQSVMHMAAGPEASLLLTFVRGRHPFRFALLFPDGRFTALTEKELGINAWNLSDKNLHWSEPAGVLVSVGEGMNSVSVNEVLSKRRRPPRLD